MRLRGIAYALVAVAIAFPQLSLAGPAFRAVCEDDKVIAFRYETDFSGKPSADGWSKGEKFLGNPWTFVYEGGDSMLINGKKAIVLGSNGPSVVAIEPGIAQAGAGVWSYVVHTDLNMIVAAQVNGFSHGKDSSNGIKTRSVSFKCNFSR
jgi:hypothetical protein